MAFANQRHITEETLNGAITGVIDAHARVGQRGACVDGIRQVVRGST